MNTLDLSFFLALTTWTGYEVYSGHVLKLVGGGTEFKEQRLPFQDVKPMAVLCRQPGFKSGVSLQYRVGVLKEENMTALKEDLYKVIIRALNITFKM